MSYCKTCSDYFCDSCQQAHKRLKLFQDHETISTESLTDSETIVKTGNLDCTIHLHEQLKLYCQTCHTLSCIHCFVASHNGHKVTGVDEKLRKETEENLAKTVQLVVTNQEEFEENLEYIKDVEKDKMEVSTRYKDEVNKKADSMIARIEARREGLLQKIDCKCDLKKLWAEREYLETAITSMDSSLQFSKRILNCKNDTMLLVLSSQVMPRLKELSQQKWDKTPTKRLETNQLKWTESTSVSISRRGDRTRYIKDMELLGDIETSHYSVSSIELTLPTDFPSKVECEQLVEFQVTAATIPRRALRCLQIEGRMRHKRAYNPSSENITLNLLGELPSPLSSYTDLKVTVEHEDSGNVWTVKFTPEQCGTYSIELKARSDYGQTFIGSHLSTITHTPAIQVVSTEEA